MKHHYTKSEIQKFIREADNRSYSGRVERLKFLLSIENQSSFPASALASEYYEEARLCWYVGAFVATIAMVQLAFEELLRSHYRVAKGVGGKLNCGIKVDQASFSNLIDEATNDKWILEEEVKSLHNLRKNVRNPYIHVKDVKVNDYGKTNLKKPNFLYNILKLKHPK
ncbi:hypothetical protein KAW50_05665 [candidate division WOR-3 bacterium]|nr:hypothetical protein [candidate division WOR-3 bacterium]